MHMLILQNQAINITFSGLSVVNKILLVIYRIILQQSIHILGFSIFLEV